MKETIYEALGNYLRQPWRAPTVVYLGDEEMKALYKEFGGILIEMYGCRLVAVERNSYVGFGTEYQEAV